MASSIDAIQKLVTKIKEMMLMIDVNPCSFISPSAYDTAWLAMIHEPKKKQKKPLFIGCLDWVLNNQKQQGFWGEIDSHGNPTIDSLPATLACMVALRTWNVGHEHVKKGMAFISAYSTKLLEGKGSHVNYPRWFAIVFPGMVQLARRRGIQVLFPDTIKEVVANIFRQRHLILTNEKLMDKYHYLAPEPLLSYLEALPATYPIDHAIILNNLTDDEGSIFQSPSATAAAFMATGNWKSLSYLRRFLPTCTRGVPSKYPIDLDCIKLYMVNQLERLGLSEYFSEEIKGILEHTYRQYNAQGPSKHGLLPKDMFKDSLAFQLLRLKGYKVSPRRLCCFLSDEIALEHIEKNYEKFSSMLYGLYRATDVMFIGETELQNLRSFLRRLLVKSSQSRTIYHDDIVVWAYLQEGLRHEITVPWIARLEHLDHRKWIEANKESPLWLGKASFYRISCLDNVDLLQLAKASYDHRQEFYRKELEELTRWSKVWGLMDMGFAREKTTYCYFAVASSISLPCDSNVRLIIAKSAVLVTIADDLFDMEGSLDELQMLAKAVQRWSNKGLSSHSRIIFDALDNFVNEVVEKYFDQHKIDITNNLRQIWSETFASWLMEATWSKTGQIPSMASYLETGMKSIAAHTVALQASLFLIPSLTPQNVNHFDEYEAITKFLMISCRLLNDIQSYEKEQKEGKFNSVLLYMKENPEANIEDAISYVQSIIDGSTMKLLEHALMEGFDDLPTPCKKLHLSCLKVFQMFFNSDNHFDSKDSLLQDINKAIYQPLEHFQPPQLQRLDFQPKKKNLLSNHCNISLQYYHNRRSSPFTIAPRVHHRVVSLGYCQGRMIISPNYYTLSIL